MNSEFAYCLSVVHAHRILSESWLAFQCVCVSVGVAWRWLGAALQEVLENQSEYFVLLASQFATMHDRIQTLKQDFVRSRQERGLSNPFEDQASGDDATKKKST